MSQTIDKQYNTKLDKWFSLLVDDVAATIRTHQTMIQTRTATPEMKALYESLMAQDLKQIMKSNRELAMKYFISILIKDYATELVVRNTKPNKLALDYNDSSVLVWAEIDDDDDETETSLILSEAKVNAKFEEYGFHLSTTVVETSDKLEVPNHYKLIA